MSTSKHDLISELETRALKIAADDDELSKQLADADATDLERRLLAVADKQDEIDARLDSLETATDKSDTSESASAGGADPDLAQQNHENLKAIFRKRGSARKFKDSVGGADWGSAFSLTAKSDHEPDAEAIQQQNAENIHILAKEMGIRSSKLDGSASSTGFADFLGLK